MEIVQQLLASRTPELVSVLTQKLGFGPDQAQRFVPAAVERVLALVQGGKLDASQLLGGDPEAVVAKLDTRELAQAAGIEEPKAVQGVGTILPLIRSLLQQQTGGAAGLISALGGGEASGGLGGLGKLASGFLKK